MQFVLITRRDLEDTNRLFRAACAVRDITIAEVVAGEVGSSGLDRTTQRLVYCAAADWNSRLVEKLLVRPGDAALHDPQFVCDHQPIRLRSAGVPMAKAVYVPDPERLQQQVDWLGGFPVVVKRPGTEGGQGVSLADNLEHLTSIETTSAMLEAFVPHDLCWRLTVLDGAVLVASASAPPDGDFRSNVSGGRIIEDAELPEGAEAIASKAVAALNLDFGGVDLMQSLNGNLYVAEVNFPCYFADQQERSGIDIAGAIVDHLHYKAGFLAS